MEEVCPILNLVLGPLHLDLLGLIVDVSQITITITAQQDSLLGNLLCGLTTPAGEQQVLTPNVAVDLNVEQPDH